MDFKTMVKQDIDQVIFNPNELGEMVNLNGKEIIAVKDNTAMIQIGGKESPGLIAADLVLYVKAKDLDATITPDMTLVVDGKKYRVLNVSGDFVIQITLQKVVGHGAGSSKHAGRAGIAQEIGRFRQ